jgi:hypothetical protein
MVVRSRIEIGLQQVRVRRGVGERQGVKVWEMTSLPEGVSGKLFIDPKNERRFSIGANASEG